MIADSRAEQTYGLHPHWPAADCGPPPTGMLQPPTEQDGFDLHCQHPRIDDAQFNALDLKPLPTLSTALIAWPIFNKLLSVISFSKTKFSPQALEFQPPKGASTQDARHTVSARVTPQTLETFNKNLGVELTTLLLERFDPDTRGGYAGQPITSMPLLSSRDRAELHNACNFVYGDFLSHQTLTETCEMYIGPGSSLDWIAPANRKHAQESRKKARRQNGQHQFTAQGRAPRPTRVVFRDAVPVVDATESSAMARTEMQLPQPSTNEAVSGEAQQSEAQRAASTTLSNGGILKRRANPSAWDSFASAEHVRVENFKTAASWQQQKQDIADNIPRTPANPVQFKETFTQKGRVGGLRRTIRIESTTHNGDSRAPIDDVGTKQSVAETVVKSDVPRCKGVPPHLRKAKRERIEREAAAKNKQCADAQHAVSIIGTELAFLSWPLR